MWRQVQGKVRVRTQYLNPHQELLEFLGGFGAQPGGSSERETFEHLNQGGTEAKVTGVTVLMRRTYPAGSAKVRSVCLNGLKRS